jgi:uncharacterized protein YodC (DUF2158 family)
MTNFQVGDLVRLKSGGPKMTIASPAEGEVYQCFWFNQIGFEYTRQSGEFRAEALRRLAQPASIVSVSSVKRWFQQVAHTERHFCL